MELYVRSLAPASVHENHRRVLDRLEELDERPDCAVTVRVWGAGVDTDLARKTEAGREILDRLEAFTDWVDPAGYSFLPLIETHPTTTLVTAETTDRIVFPTMVLAEYEDGTLRHVAPATDGERVRTVGDRLDELEATTSPSPERPGPNRAATDATPDMSDD